jgi:hypothetical protein
MTLIAKKIFLVLKPLQQLMEKKMKITKEDKGFIEGMKIDGIDQDIVVLQQTKIEML